MSDRDQIESLIRRYFAGVDGDDYPLIGSTLHEDAELWVDARLVSRGRPDIGTFIRRTRLKLGTVGLSTHALKGIEDFQVDGCAASAKVRALLSLEGTKEGQCLEYHDAYTNVEGVWLIRRRHLSTRVSGE